MSASDFIILRIHPDHPKVLRLAQLTGEDKFTVCGRAVAWFRYADQNFSDALTGLTRESFLSILGVSPSALNTDPHVMDYYDAMSHALVKWIETDPTGHVLIAEYEANFSESSKRRSTDARRKHQARRASAMCPQVVRDVSAKCPEIPPTNARSRPTPRVQPATRHAPAELFRHPPSPTAPQNPPPEAKNEDSSAASASAMCPQNVQKTADLQTQTQLQTHEDEDPSAAQMVAAAKPRPPNPLWDAVAGIWFAGQVADAHKSRVGRLVRDLRSLGATPDEIQTRHERYVAEWPGAEPTPEALIKHWHRFAAAPGSAAPGGGGDTPAVAGRIGTPDQGHPRPNGAAPRGARRGRGEFAETLSL